MVWGSKGALGAGGVDVRACGGVTLQGLCPNLGHPWWQDQALGAPIQLWVLELALEGQRGSPAPAGRLTLAVRLSPQVAGVSPGRHLVPAEASCGA